jgi:hypothetical protein
MSINRNAVVESALAVLLLLGSSVRAMAQDTAPDLHMLLNLDLFSVQPPASSGAAIPDGRAAGTSMLEQIRTLSAMGYLDNGGQSGVRTSSMGHDAAPSPWSGGAVEQDQTPNQNGDPL